MIPTSNRLRSLEILKNQGKIIENDIDLVEDVSDEEGSSGSTSSIFVDITETTTTESDWTCVSTCNNTCQAVLTLKTDAITSVTVSGTDQSGLVVQRVDSDTGEFLPLTAEVIFDGYSSGEAYLNYSYFYHISNSFTYSTDSTNPATTPTPGNDFPGTYLTLYSDSTYQYKTFYIDTTKTVDGTTSEVNLDLGILNGATFNPQIYTLGSSGEATDYNTDSRNSGRMIFTLNYYDDQEIPSIYSYTGPTGGNEGTLTIMNDIGYSDTFQSLSGDVGDIFYITDLPGETLNVNLQGISSIWIQVYSMCNNDTSTNTTYSYGATGGSHQFSNTCNNN